METITTEYEASILPPIERCERCKRPGAPPHTCPYQLEINDDPEIECTCCAHCESECARDV